MRRTGIAAILLLLLGVTAPREAAARSWVSGRNPCSGRMLARYYGLIEGRPSDSWALGKLLRCLSLKQLARRYEARVKSRPKNYNYRIILGNLQMRRKDYAKAAASFRVASTLDPKRYLGHYRLADALRKLKQPEKARQAYDKALARTRMKRLKKKILRSLIDLTMTTRGGMANARRYFKALVALEPSNRLLRMEFAQMLTRNLKYAEALTEYKTLLKRYRGNSRYTADLYKEIGKVYEKMGKDPQAKKSYWTAMRYLTAGHWMRTELYQRIIAIYRRKNALRSLIEELRKKWHGRGFFQWKILAALYDETGDDEHAIKAYKAALRIKPYAIDVRAKLIAMLTRLNRQKEAIRVLETQVRMAPGEPRFHLDLAEMLWSERLHKRALAVLRRLGARFPRDPSVHLALADRYNKWGKPKLALRAYKRLVQIEPRDYSHLINLGEQYWQRGNRRLALATWKRILAPRMFRSREEAYATIASVYAEHDLNKKAITYYEKAIKLNPKKVEYHRALAMALQKQRQFDKAVAKWQQVIEMCVKKRHSGWRREARTAIIDIWHRKRVLNQKLAKYRTQFNGRPPNLKAGYFMGEAYLKLKKLKQAEQVYQRILEIDGDQVEAMLALEQIYRESYRLRKAIAILQRLIKAVPKRAREFHDRIAILYLQLYQDKKAIEHATAALKLAKNDASGWARLGAIYEKKEDWSRATKAYRKALKLNNRLFKVYFSLARIYMMLGNHVGAAKLYHEVIRRSPDEEFVRQAAKRAIDIDEYLGALLDLERELIPLAFTYTHKKTYRKSLVKLYARLVPRLSFEARFEHDPKRRKRARDLLHQIGQRALKPLLEALSEKQGSQRDIAIDVLGHLGNKNAAPPLVRLALQPPPEDQVAPTPPPSMVRYRYHRYRRRYHAPVRKTSAHTALKVRALVAAGRLRDPRTARDLIKLLGDKDVEVREAAAWALSLLSDRRAEQALRKALDDSKVGVEIFACVGLGLQKRPPVDLMIRAARDRRRRPEVRAACAFGLGLTRSKKAVPVLLGLLHEERDVIVRKAAWALGLLGDRSVVATLARQVWVRTGAVQKALSWALVRSVQGGPYGPGHDSRVRVVEGRLDWAAHLAELKPLRPQVTPADLQRTLRQAGRPLAEGLQIALERHRDLVLRILQGLDRDPRTVSLPMLGRWPTGKKGAALAPALEPLRQALRRSLQRLAAHRDPDIRMHALRLAAKVDHPRVIQLLRQGLEDQSALVRRAAGEAAVIVSERQPARRRALVQLLVHDLPHKPWYEQLDRLSRLGELGAAEAVPVLQRFASSRHGFLAEAAVRGLGRIGDRRALPEVRAALRYPAEMVRIAGLRALVRLQGRGAAAALSRLANKDPSPSVRAAARAALKRLR